MDRRNFITNTAMIAGAFAASGGRAYAQRQATDEESDPVKRVPLLANDYVAVWESPDPQNIYGYSPGLCRVAGGRLIGTTGSRLIATMDRGGPGVKKEGNGPPMRGTIYTSDDRGKTWQLRARNPMMHARPFVAGDGIYVLGHRGRLMITRSDDGGDNWSEATYLTKSGAWHQAPCNVHYANGNIYLVMEHNTEPSFGGWAVSRLAPVLMRASVEDDLTSADAWTFASELSFQQVMERYGEPDLIGTPFFHGGPQAPDNKGDRRWMFPPGWLETNVVQFTDPAHIFHDPEGRTFHLFMRAHTGTTNLACMAKVIEHEDGSMTTDLERAPSGEPMLYVPCPGGQMKFHILYDEETSLYWLLSSQSTDSMTRPELLSPERFNLPNNERHRLALHLSKNCIDWCFAGMVAIGDSPKQSRHYASMTFDGDDLHVLSRSGDQRAKNAHDGNLITFHTVRDFRGLVY